MCFLNMCSSISTDFSRPVCVVNLLYPLEYGTKIFESLLGGGRQSLVKAELVEEEVLGKMAMEFGRSSPCPSLSITL